MTNFTSGFSVRGRLALDYTDQVCERSLKILFSPLPFSRLSFIMFKVLYSHAVLFYFLYLHLFFNKNKALKMPPPPLVIIHRNNPLLKGIYIVWSRMTMCLPGPSPRTQA